MDQWLIVARLTRAPTSIRLWPCLFFEDMANEKQYTFIDLFAGLGGFHLALKSLGCKCVFASELREDLRRLYSINYPEMQGQTETGIKKIEGDITAVRPQDIPAHDILCAGFPCQPFSQAGKRQGFGDEKMRGTMFGYICKIIEHHNPKFLFLENVSNLKGHDGGNTWKVIKSSLEELGYNIHDAILSPHEFGIPQHRKRIYIVGRKKKNEDDVFDFEFPTEKILPDYTVHNIIEEDVKDYMPLRPSTRKHLELWNEFVKNTIANGCKLPGFPIWAMEFGANYDFKETAPAFQTIDDLRGKRGHLGRLIDGNTLEECIAQLPNYAQSTKDKVFPHWKMRYIEQNREFYNKNKKWLDQWLPKIQDQANSFLKLEWNCGEAEPTLNDKIIQFRASGIRVKLATFSPALNLVGTQVPILPWVSLPDSKEKGRYMTVREAASLQGMEDLDLTGLPTNRIYEALGNAVNVQVVQEIAKRLLQK